MKKRAFEDDEAPEREPSAPPPERTEPAPYARTAIALIVGSWALPLFMLVALFRRSEDEPGTMLLHRVLTLSTLGLLLAGFGVAIRSIDLARKNARVRRRMAYAALLLGLLSPVVWTSELTLAWRVFLTRTRLDAEADATSPPAE